MNWQLVALDAIAPQPWRNGRGVTRELLALPDAASWKIRMSVADITAPCNFSRFDGVERWFAVVDGDGVILHTQGKERLLTRADAPLCFDGASPVHCTLFRDSTRDFNLMAPPGRAQVWRVRGRRSFRAGAGQLLAVYCHREFAQLETAARRFEVPPRHLAWVQLDQAASGTLVSDHALWIEVAP
jgi:environmental stress-induced protein Ves